MNARLDFNAIAKAVRFQDLLDYLNIPYTSTNSGELKGEGFIVNIEKNRYTNPTGRDYGNTINFLVVKKCMGWRDAAIYLRDNFLLDKDKPIKELPIYPLKYDQDVADLGISEETAKTLEIGKVHSHRGKAAGQIVFRVRDVEGEPVGYCIYFYKEKKYFFYEGYKHDHIYNLNNVPGKIAVLFEDPINCARHHEYAPVCISMTRGSITKAQLDLLKRFEYLIISHHDPKQADYLVNKLSKFMFVMVLGTQDEKDVTRLMSFLEQSKN